MNVGTVVDNPYAAELLVNNRNKSVILIFSAIIELVRELVICNMHNKFGKDIWKTF